MALTRYLRFHTNIYSPWFMIMAKQNKLLPLIEGFMVHWRDIAGLDARKAYLHIMQGFIKNLAFRLKNTSIDIIAHRHIESKPTRGSGDSVEQRSVGTVAHDEGEEAHVLRFDQIYKLGMSLGTD